MGSEGKLKNLNLQTGRRKTAVARVLVKEGKDDFRINGRSISDYFSIESLRKMILSPLEVTDSLGRYEIKVNVYGGGISSQAGAIRMGLARALLSLNPDYRPIFKSNRFLTRDSRQVERKKYGKKKARKSFQFSKR